MEVRNRGQKHLDKNPTWMLENEKAKYAIFESSSSYVDQAYRRFFFSRLNPHSQEEMSAFFELLERHTDSVYDKLSEERGRPPLNPFFRRDEINAWRRATAGIRSAIQNGDFSISLSDFHALYANRISERISGDTRFLEAAKEIKEGKMKSWVSADEDISEREVRLSYVISELYNCFQGTASHVRRSFQRASRRGTLGESEDGGPAILIFNAFYETLSFWRVFNLDNTPGEFLVAATHSEASTVQIAHFSKREHDFLRFVYGMFTSPFYRPSTELHNLFQIAVATNLSMLNNADVILRFWDSDEYRKVLESRFSMEFNSFATRRGASDAAVIDLAVSSMFGHGTVNPSNWTGEVYRDLVVESEFFKAMIEASKESGEITAYIEEMTKPLIDNTDAGRSIN